MSKLKLFILFAALPLASLSQYSPLSFSEFYFARQPSARAESMGHAYSSIDGDMASAYYNPAGMATIKTAELNGSYTPPNAYKSKGFYVFFGAGISLNKYLKLGVSRLRFDWGETVFVNTDKKAYTQTSTLTLASEPIKGLLIGANANYFEWQPGRDGLFGKLCYDFGMIYKLNLVKSERPQSFSVGASISNLGSGVLKVTSYGVPQDLPLPAIARIGANYQTSFGNFHLIDSVSTIKVLTQIEYQMLLNNKDLSWKRVGAEVTIMELLSLRGGYFSETLNNFGYPEINKSVLNVFTYGAGLEVPVYKLTKVPLKLCFDYVSFPQPQYSKRPTSTSMWKNFSTYTLRIVLISSTKRKK